ncbi:Alpha-L-fucosidase [Planctomycetes bacterium CA13]|uniref:alpha-L-fucosidase n=1 Tax=Novipirellula herctigrandis TaxID=2527986 RepID=A0A5C5Z5R7_9BACT|nr:Alpha-L-fucosidase [Planctomycetes bacterium CA13]
MNRTTLITFALALCTAAPAIAQTSPNTPNVDPTSPVPPTVSAGVMLGDKMLNNRPERLEWLRDNGFGMFIHFSHDSQIGSVISHSLVGASKEYTDWYLDELPKTFNPKHFDADAIASLARVCGMKYVVLTAKHHNGFCLWDSATTDFKITNTPFKRDLLKEYVVALRNHGLAVGIYYSPEDFAWSYRHGFEVRRRDLPFEPNQYPPAVQFIREQVTELFTNYGKIDMLFIDGTGEIPTKQVAWSINPDCIITRGAIPTPEQFVPGRAPQGAWESNMTMGTQWSYKPTNDRYKSGGRIIEILIETRCKGGSLMMNVGPKPDGGLPIEQESRLREVALWRAANNEAIFDVRPWVVTNEDDIWFARHKASNAVYVFLTRIPDWSRGSRKEFILQSVRSTDKTKISVLGQSDRLVEYSPSADAKSRFEQTEDGLRISVVRAQRLYNDHKWLNPVVVKLENVQPAFDTPPYAETVASKSVTNHSVSLSGKLIDKGDAAAVEVGFEYQIYEGFAEAMYNTNWTRSPMNRISEEGAFEIEISDLKPATEYQYRAIVKHPRITIRGDHLRFKTK